MTFMEYLKTQIGRPKYPEQGDTVADFAHDAITDPTPPPDSATYEDWVMYLKSENAIPQAMSSFEIAWKEFQELK